MRITEISIAVVIALAVGMAVRKTQQQGLDSEREINLCIEAAGVVEGMKDLIKGNAERRNLLEQILEATGERRKELITQFEKMNTDYSRFYHDWINIQKADPYAGWTDSGYHPQASTFPPDIQVLAATSYGVSDIRNGGLHQFFGNSTGGFAPEMVLWFDRVGLKQCAATLKTAMLFFGAKFPRSQEERRKMLDDHSRRFQGGREQGDPFFALDGTFYAGLHQDGKNFDEHCDAWIRGVCGIKSLHDPIPSPK
jgi:hypothetical protein